MRVVPGLLRDNRQFRTFFAGQSPIPRMRALPATEEPDEQAAGKVVAVS